MTSEEFHVSTISEIVSTIMRLRVGEVAEMTAEDVSRTMALTNGEDAAWSWESFVETVKQAMPGAPWCYSVEFKYQGTLISASAVRFKKIDVSGFEPTAPETGFAVIVPGGGQHMVVEPLPVDPNAGDFNAYQRFAESLVRNGGRFHTGGIVGNAEEPVPIFQTSDFVLPKRLADKHPALGVPYTGNKKPGSEGDRFIGMTLEQLEAQVLRESQDDGHSFVDRFSQSLDRNGEGFIVGNKRVEPDDGNKRVEPDDGNKRVEPDDGRDLSGFAPMPNTVNVSRDGFDPAGRAGFHASGERPYPELLTPDEQKALLTQAEHLWVELQNNDLGGFSGVNRPFYILEKFKDVIQAFGKRDVGLDWSKDQLEAAKGITASKAHGEQDPTPENWDGERRARYWQRRAQMVETSASAVLTFWDSANGFTKQSMQHLMETLRIALAESRKDDGLGFERFIRDRRQAAMLRWALRAFGSTLGDDVCSPRERALRFFEEASELYHAVIFRSYAGDEETIDTNVVREMARIDFARAMQVFTDRWNAEPGAVSQEFGGAALTLNILAEALGTSLAQMEENEFNRVLAKPASHWQARAKLKKDQGL